MTSNFDVTVAIPSIPPRAHLLRRAVDSVLNQTWHSVAGISIAVDTRKEGAGPTRQRALEGVNTPWVAFLDDDDEFLPHHIEALIQHAIETDADFVYSWFKVVTRNGIMERDPVFPPTHFTDPWNNANPRHTTVTTLVRTELAQRVRFVRSDYNREVDGHLIGEDYDFTLRCMAAGAKISHLVEHTWLWHHDSGNTSGRPDRW